MKESLTITYNNTEIGELRGFIDEHGEPWFFAGKVCDCLKIKNSADAILKLKQKHLRYGDKIDGIAKREVVIKDSKGRKNKATIINENLLYELIFQSQTEKAFKFQQWVFTEVLPALRKRGEYRMNGKLIRRSLTDVIKAEICEKAESVNEKRFAYKNYTNLIYKSLGLKPPVDRDSLPEETLEKIAKKENLVSLLIQDGKSYNQIKNIILGA
jgi:prophage antirepressor-like protein